MSKGKNVMSIEHANRNIPKELIAKLITNSVNLVDSVLRIPRDSLCIEKNKWNRNWQKH